MLLVDDDDDHREILGMLLASHGFQVLLAEGGRTALDIARAGGVDVIVLDVMMPGMDGFEVCRELRKSPATVSLPVILLTGRDDLAARVASMDEAVSGFLTKPVNEGELVMRIKQNVRSRRHPLPS